MNDTIMNTKKHPHLYGEPTTKIEYEHFVWWYNLPRLWQQIFLISLRHPEHLSPQIYIDEQCIGGNGADIDFYLNYPVPLEIDKQELAQLFELTAIAYNRGDVNPQRHTVVHKIPPLHYFKNLEYLSLDQNYIDDYSGLQGLNHLKYLCLYENLTNDGNQLNYISKLTSLEILDLSFNFFDDLSPLSNLVNLKSLAQVGGVRKPVNITGFEKLKKLEYLDFGVPMDFTPLASLKNLKILDFGTDEYEFDCSKIEWLKEQLPNCGVDYCLPCISPHFTEEVSDETFLWKIILEGHKYNRFYGIFDKSRLFSLFEKYQHSDDKKMKNLVIRAMYDYKERWKENVPY